MRFGSTQLSWRPGAVLAVAISAVMGTVRQSQAVPFRCALEYTACMAAPGTDPKTCKRLYDLCVRGVGDWFSYQPQFDPIFGSVNGTPQLIWTPGSSVTLAAARQDMITGNLLNGPGDVTSVQMSVAPASLFFANTPYEEIPFAPLGNASYDSQLSRWILSLNTSAYNDPQGYVFHATFYDPTIPYNEECNIAAGQFEAVMYGRVTPEPTGLIAVAAGSALLRRRRV